MLDFSILVNRRVIFPTKKLGEVLVPERQKWKDTKGEGYTPLFL